MSTTIATQSTEQTTQPQREKYTPITPEPSPNARPVVPAVIGKCGHWARSVDHTCGQWTCVLNWEGY